MCASVDSSIEPGDIRHMPSDGVVLNSDMGVWDLGTDIAKVDVKWW